jgi:anti-anti-sigma factor
MLGGEETAAFRRFMDESLPWTPNLVLHLGGVEFIDSSGLGLLVRYLTRVRNAHGAFGVCAVSPKLQEVLRVTRLQSVFQPYETEEEAIADAHRGGREGLTPLAPAEILCVDSSPDVVAYVHSLLKQAGHHAITATNLPDALILLTATRPRVVVIGAGLKAARETQTADKFHKLASARAVVDLPPGFAAHDAGAAAQHVLDAVSACLTDSGSTNPSPPGSTRTSS